jgi:hypothetical protein
MRRCSLALLYLLVCPTVHAHGDERIARRPGVWEITTSSVAQKVSPLVSKICLDADVSNDALQDMACEHYNIARDGDRLVIDAVCTSNRLRITRKKTVTFTGDVAYHIDTNEHYDPPFEGRSDLTMTEDAKWLGPCPAGVRPYEWIEPPPGLIIR